MALTTHIYKAFAFVILLNASIFQAGISHADAGPPGKETGFVPESFNKSQPPLKLSLSKCIEIALANNHQRKISAIAVSIARAQHKQVLSSYWPSILLNASISRLDEDPNFIFPEETSQYSITGMTMPEMTVDLGSGPVTIPALPLPSQQVTVSVPEKNIKIMDKNLGGTFLDLTYPLYTGGKRSALVTQTNAGISAARQAARRADIMVIYDVKRMYYGTILAEILYNIGMQAKARLNATLELTEYLYKKGSGSVNKSDYLKNKIMVETAKAAVAMLDGNRKIAKAALLNTLGLEWQTQIELLETEIPFTPVKEDLTTLVSSSYKFNPDWQQVLAGIDAAKANVKEKKGERYPNIALTGSLFHLINDYDEGVMSPENKNGWQVGIGMQVPLFSGFLTSQKINEAQSRLDKIKEQQILLKEGIALQITHIFHLMNSYQNQVTATGNAVQSAVENRELMVRAYNSGLTEAEKLIEAQMFETFAEVINKTARYNHAVARFRLDYLVGREVNKLFLNEK